MKVLCCLLAVVFMAGPVSAITYHFDYSAGTSGVDGYYLYEPNETPSQGDIHVTGKIETDGTLGSISAGNIVRWEFSLNGPQNSLAISSDGDLANDGPDDSIFAAGMFIATAATLTFGNTVDFTQFDAFAGSEPDSVTTVGGRIQRRGSVNTLAIQVNTQLCATQTDCSGNLYFGETAYERGSAPVGYAVSRPPVVPLPASAMFLIAALGGLGVLRRLV